MIPERIIFVSRGITVPGIVYFMGDKGGRCAGLTTLPPSYADCLEIWEPQPGTVRECLGQSRDCFTIFTPPHPPIERCLRLSVHREKRQVNKSEVHRSLQYRGSSERDLLHVVTFMLPRVWRWLLDFWKICGLLIQASRTALGPTRFSL